jgi:hypothetical protein
VKTLTTISGVNIIATDDDSHIYFTSNLDICNDGSGPKHNDPSYQSQTAYYNGGKFLNADKDQYIVIPPQVRKLVKRKVMGCKARITNTETKVTEPAVTGEIGPSSKTGEAAYCLAKKVNPKITYNSGDSRRIYKYELWPGVPAIVDGKTYKLE